MNDFKFDHHRLPSAWNSTRFLLRGKLTDRQIERYRRAGWYSEDFRRARRDLVARKMASRLKREGNFVLTNGRLIYSPA